MNTPSYRQLLLKGSLFVLFSTSLPSSPSFPLFPEVEAKPIELIWHEPLLTFEKNERVTYLIEYWYHTPTGETRSGPGRRVTVRVTDADPWIRLYTLGADRPEEEAQLKPIAAQLFDELSFLLAGSHVQPFQWYEQVRGLGMAIPPPPGPKEPIQIGKRGEFFNRFEIIGEIIQLIGQKKFRARIVGWEIAEGYPCLKIEGIITTSMNDGGPQGPPSLAEIAYAPAAGRIVKATLGKGSGMQTVIRWVAPPGPMINNPTGVPTHESLFGGNFSSSYGTPTSEGIRPVFPPLAKRMRDAAVALQQASARRDREEAVKTAGLLLADPEERGVVEHGKEWHWGIGTYVRETLGELVPEFLAAPNGTHYPQPHKSPWDAAREKHVERTQQRIALADTGAREALHNLVALPPRREASTWHSVQLLSLEAVPITPETHAGLYATAASSTLWLVRNGDLQSLSETHSSFETWKAVHALEEGDLVLASLADDTPARPDLRAWNLDRPPDIALPLALDWPEAMAPYRVVTDAWHGPLLYFLGQSSTGEHHQLLSAWDLTAQRWAFQHRWLTTLNVPEGGTKGVTVSSVLNPDGTALLCWFSIGLLVCTDARTGEMKWTRVLDPGPKPHLLPRLSASATIVCGWFPHSRELAAFALATGQELWRVKRPQSLDLIGVMEGRVHIAEGGSAAALDESSGAEIWRFASPVPGEELSGTGLLLQGKVWLPYGNHLYALDAKNGKLVSQITRADASVCRLLPDPQDPDRFWILTADRLAQYAPTAASHPGGAAE